MVDRDTMFAELAKRGFSETYKVSTFECYREREDGGMQEVKIEVLDRGPGAGDLRYTVRATDDESRLATGNPRDNLTDAVRGVHWYDLDKPVRAKNQNRT